MSKQNFDDVTGMEKLRWLSKDYHGSYDCQACTAAGIADSDQCSGNLWEDIKTEMDEYEWECNCKKMRNKALGMIADQIEREHKKHDVRSIVVLDADGNDIMPGDTVWANDCGEPLTVISVKYSGEEPSVVFVCDCSGFVTAAYKANEIHRKRTWNIDTQEDIDKFVKEAFTLNAVCLVEELLERQRELDKKLYCKE